MCYYAVMVLTSGFYHMPFDLKYPFDSFSLKYWGFPGGSDGKESACSVRDLGLIPGSGRCPGEGNNYQHQYSC